jgi:hypothetical protein
MDPICNIQMIPQKASAADRKLFKSEIQRSIIMAGNLNVQSQRNFMNVTIEKLYECERM